jgi:hypothetical protein
MKGGLNLRYEKLLFTTESGKKKLVDKVVLLTESTFNYFFGNKNLDEGLKKKINKYKKNFPKTLDLLIIKKQELLNSIYDKLYDYSVEDGSASRILKIKGIDCFNGYIFDHRYNQDKQVDQLNMSRIKCVLEHVIRHSLPFKQYKKYVPAEGDGMMPVVYCFGLFLYSFIHLIALKEYCIEHNIEIGLNWLEFIEGMQTETIGLIATMIAAPVTTHPDVTHLKETEEEIEEDFFDGFRDDVPDEITADVAPPEEITGFDDFDEPTGFAEEEEPAGFSGGRRTRKKRTKTRRHR